MMQKNKIHFIFFADTHLGFDYPIKPRVHRRRRGQDFFDNYSKVLQYSIENKVDFVIHGGDFFFRSKVPQKIVDLAYESLFEFAERGIPFFIVPGNHERSKLPMSLFVSHPNIRVFDKPKTYIINLNETTLAIAGFPFQRDNIKTRFVTILESTNWKNTPANVKLLCVHQAIEGAQVGLQNYTFRYGQDVVQMRDIPADFHAVLSGHIHRKQILVKHTQNENSKLPVIYPGSTERTSFVEKLEDKGFFEIKLIAPNADDWKISEIRFITLPTRPMVDLNIDGSVDPHSLESYLKSRISEIHPDAIVRLKCDNTLNDLVRVKLTSRFVRDFFPKTMNVEFGSGFRQYFYER